MARSKGYDEVAQALVEGIRDHGPMNTTEAIAFLSGYGIELNAATAPQYIRQAVHYSDSLTSTGERGNCRYTLKETP